MERHITTMLQNPPESLEVRKIVVQSGLHGEIARSGTANCDAPPMAQARRIPMKLSPRLCLWLIPCSLLLLASGEVQASTGPTVTSLSLNPSKISGGSGGTSTATVMLSGVAPVGGTLVALSSSNPALAAVGPSVTVPAGQSSATITVWTNAGYRRYSGLSFAPVISASANGSAQSATLTVTAQRLPADIQNDTADRHGTVCGGRSPPPHGDKRSPYQCSA